MNSHEAVQNARRQRGLSIAELLVVAVLLGIIFYMVFRMLEPGLRVWRQSDVRVRLQQSTLVAMYRLSNELKESNQNSVTLKPCNIVTDRVSMLVCFASARNNTGDLVLLKDQFGTGAVFDTGEPNLQKYVIYYRDDKRRMRRYETAVPSPAPTPAYSTYRESGSMHINGDPLAYIHIDDIAADPVVSRDIEDFTVDYTPVGSDWKGGLLVKISAKHDDPNPAEQFEMKLETTVRVRYDDKDF
jgi:hypothetical protein